VTRPYAVLLEHPTTKSYYGGATYEYVKDAQKWVAAMYPAPVNREYAQTKARIPKSILACGYDKEKVAEATNELLGRWAGVANLIVQRNPAGKIEEFSFDLEEKASRAVYAETSLDDIEDI
jgi:hypothetical protein